MALGRGKRHLAKRIAIIIGAVAGLVGIAACCLFVLGFVTGIGDLSTLTSGFRSGPFRRHTTVSVGTGAFEETGEGAAKGNQGALGIKGSTGNLFE